MGKSKKDKKSKRDADDSDGDEMTMTIEKNETAVDDELAGASSKPNKKKKKEKAKGKKVVEDDSDDDMDVLAKGVGSDDEDDVVQSKPAAKKKTKPKMSAFQMLDMMSDSDDKEEASDSPEEVVVVEKPKKQNKKGKKAAAEENEDIDAILMEMNDGAAAEEEIDDTPQPAKKSKEKKKKKKQKEEKVEEEDDIDAILASMNYTDDPSALPGEKPETEKVDEITKEIESVTLNDEAKGDGEVDDAEGGTLKTKAQKKKEKREKERQKKKELKAKGGAAKEEPEDDTKRPDSAERDEVANEQEDVAKEPTLEGDEGETEESSKKKKDKKKKKTKEEKEEEERAKKKPGKAKLKAMQEALAALKEQEEKRLREEEEKEKKEEEARLAKLEAERLEKERKEKLKQKKKEREQRLKEEGKWLTEKQKADRRRAMQMLEMMKQQGIEVPQKAQNEDQAGGEKKKRVVYEKKKKRPQLVQTQKSEEARPASPVIASSEVEVKTPEVVKVESVTEDVKEEVVVKDVADEIKDDWDADSDEEKETAAQKEPEVEAKPEEKPEEVEDNEEEEEEDDEEEEESSEEESDSEEDEDESSEEESDDDLTQAEKVRIRAQERIHKRQEENEKARTTDVLRSPVVCVLGHVDTGKTKILDKLRRTNVQDGEAGGITQQIGATNVPVAAIQRQTEMCKEFSKNALNLPGLLIIDTPGHESFSNLRSRGSSLCDIAILVVDIMHGLEPQTLESIQLLKKRKTPFVVALNKIDRLFQWKTNPTADVVNTLKKQQKHTKDEFDERVRNIVLEFANQSLNVTLFYENKNPKEWISLVPTSAHTGDGMGNLMATICEFSQTLLAKRLAYSNELQATVMEVKALPGLGTTIDVCLVNGKLREGQTIIVAGQEGPIVTQIRGLLIPPPMKELRVKNQYEKVKEMKAAHGVKIIAKDLEKALAGLPMYACFHPDEVEIVKEEVANQLKNALNSIKLSDRGVFVQASTLGSLEALLEFLKSSKIPYAGIGVGPVHKKDVMRASVMIEHDVQYAVILAFDVKVEREAQDLADSLGVRIFTADIIYHLFDRFMEYREQYKQRKKDEFRHIAVFPCKMRILPQFIFNSRDPIVMGISVEGGVVRQGTPVCVPSKEFVELGRITSLEINNKPIESARKGQDVCIKIDPVPGEAPKMFGRHFEAEDMLMSSISRESIDAVKEYFRDEMQKTDWQLMIELKKIFKIP